MHQPNIPFVQIALQAEKMIFELIWHFRADTDTYETILESMFSGRCREGCSPQLRGGQHSISKCIGYSYYFIVDKDTEKYYIRIIFALDLD